MLAGVVELVLRLTIAKEKIELSVPISSPMHARTCVCVSDYSEWLVFCVCLCAHQPFSPLVVLVRAAQRNAAEKDTAVAQ